MSTLRQFTYLVALADYRNFRRAADAVQVSQPTLSQQLRTLEARLGVTLVERNESPVQLTPVGREVVARARKLLLEVKDIEDMARRAKTGMDMRLYVREGIPDEQVRELGRGDLDMILSPLPVSGSGLHIEPLFREPLHIVCPPDHPVSKAALVRKQDLAGVGFLSLDQRHHAYRQVREACDELGARMLEDYQGTSLDALRQMCGSGLGFAIIPELYLRSEAGGEDMVRRLDLADWSASRSIAAVWREGAAYADSYRIIAEAIATEARGILSEVR